MTAIGVIIPPELCRQLFLPEDRRALDELGQVRWWSAAAAPTAEEATEFLQGCGVGVGSWGTPHPGSPGLLAGCPDLWAWEHVAGSVKKFFNEHSDGRDLIIGSCKGAIADCVAELVVAEVIIGRRRLWANAQANRQGPTGKPADIGVCFGATVGIVGASEVGRRVARLLRPFGCELLLYDPYCAPATAADLGVEAVDDLIELCRRSRVLTVHTPLTPATRQLLRVEHFQALADDAVLINTSRGPCLDESALIAELQRGRLFAFLDVTDPEPAAADSPLRQLDNVVLTSHIAGPATANMGRQCLADVRALLTGGEPACRITRGMLDRIA